MNVIVHQDTLEGNVKVRFLLAAIGRWHLRKVHTNLKNLGNFC